MMYYKEAKVKFNGGQGATLCNECNKILLNCFPIKDKLYFCNKQCESKYKYRTLPTK